MKSCDKCVCALLHSCVASPITVVCRHAGAGEGAAEEQAALRAVIVEAIADGGSLRAVAAVIGRSHAAVAKWLKEEKNSE